ncbi:MAG: TonB-dependent receptor [Candidatus Cloacimonetes bacterium]|nr:TonB-dependent receptor [Candidatus Cloacimonadota bacterium]
MRRLIPWLMLLLVSRLAAAEIPSESVPADSLGSRRYLLETVRVIADKPGEAAGAVHLMNPGGRASAPLNLYEGLQGQTGVTNTSGTRDESNLRLRGFRKNELKVLIDGRPLNSGYFGNVDLHQLAAEDIREIQIVKGPNSAVFGSGTMGGVVNIVTADPDNSSWLNLEALAKRNNSNRFSLSSAHQIRDFSYRVSLAREHSEGLVLPRSFIPTPFENGFVRNHSRKTQYDLHTRLGWQANAFRQLGFSAGLTWVPEKLIPSSIYSLDIRRYLNWLRHWATLEYEEVLSEYLKLSSHLYYDGGQDTYQQFLDAAQQQLSVDSDMRYRTLGFNPRLQWALGKHTLDLGLRAESLHSSRKDTGNYPDWTPHWLNIYNAFGIWKYRPSELISLSAGLGLSGHQSDLKRALDLYPEPSAGISFHWAPQSVSSLAWARNSSFPTMRQLFSAENGNPDLKPQHAHKLELDHRQGQKLGGILLSHRLAVFYNDVRDLIDRLGEQYQNIHQMRSWGAEYQLLFNPFPWWESELGYSCLFWTAAGGYQLTETPRNQVSLHQQWSLPWDLELLHSCAYNDIRISQDASEVYHTLDAYWLHDLAVSREFKRFSLRLGLENILDTYYETEYGFPGPGINFFLKLGVKI